MNGKEHVCMIGKFLLVKSELIPVGAFTPGVAVAQNIYYKIVLVFII